MKRRFYGPRPYSVVVVHGGPGARGALAPVARELAANYGVLEPFQQAKSLAGQVAGLAAEIRRYAAVPVGLVGWSWGAWLGYLVAGRFPDLVGKLILVSSGPFKESYAEEIMPTRLGRLTEEERARVGLVMEKLQRGEADEGLFREFGLLMDRADSFDPLPGATAAVEFQPEVYQAVWPEVSRLRSSGGLLEAGREIRCPVVAIHGDYDSHPAVGVREPLARVLDDFRFILLEECGHTPWRERRARRRFFDLLRQELESGGS